MHKKYRNIRNENENEKKYFHLITEKARESRATLNMVE